MAYPFSVTELTLRVGEQPSYPVTCCPVSAINLETHQQQKYVENAFFKREGPTSHFLKPILPAALDWNTSDTQELLDKQSDKHTDVSVNIQHPESANERNIGRHAIVTHANQHRTHSNTVRRPRPDKTRKYVMGEHTLRKGVGGEHPLRKVVGGEHAIQIKHEHAPKSADERTPHLIFSTLGTMSWDEIVHNNKVNSFNILQMNSFMKVILRIYKKCNVSFFFNTDVNTLSGIVAGASLPAGTDHFNQGDLSHKS